MPTQPTEQALHVIKLNAPVPRLEAADIDSIDCVLCHGQPQSPVQGKRKRHEQPGAVSKVFLWQYHNLLRMA